VRRGPHIHTASQTHLENVDGAASDATALHQRLQVVRVQRSAVVNGRRVVLSQAPQVQRAVGVASQWHRDLAVNGRIVHVCFAATCLVDRLLEVDVVVAAEAHEKTVVARQCGQAAHPLRTVVEVGIDVALTRATLAAPLGV
jgi:hypothetical protein